MAAVEIEIEWRHRLNIVEAQRLLLNLTRGRDIVYVENYRVRNHGELHKRLGELKMFRGGSFSFRTFEELLTLFEAPFANYEKCGALAARPEITLLSMIKLTTCFHTYFFFDETCTLESNNKFPRLFCCKRSSEIQDQPMMGKIDTGSDTPTSEGNFEPIFEPSSPNYSPTGFAGSSTEAFELRPIVANKPVDEYERLTPNVEVTGGNAAVVDVDLLKKKLKVSEDFERDKSDNNLGLRFYRKVYFFVKNRIRVCLYAILDEFGTVRYEIGVERELLERESSLRSLRECMYQCSQVIEEAIKFLEYVECPTINLAVGWMNENNGNATIRSYGCSPSATKHVKLYEAYFADIFDKACFSQQNKAADFLVKLKINGIRLFAVFNGNDRLYLSDGSEIDLKIHLPLNAVVQSYNQLFSTDFVYQLERLDPPNSTSENSTTKPMYFFTDVLAARNRYTAQIQPHIHGFSSTTVKYKKQPGQEWPYNLIGTSIAEESELIRQIASARRDTCKSLKNGQDNGAKKSNDWLKNFESSLAQDADNPSLKSGANNGGEKNQSRGQNNHGFVSVNVESSQKLLQSLQNSLDSLMPRSERIFHANLFFKPADVLPLNSWKAYAYAQFLAVYKHLLKLFNESPNDSAKFSRLLDRCHSVMFSKDLQTIRNDDAEENHENEDGSIKPFGGMKWFYDFQQKDLFEYTDGFLLYRKQRPLASRRNRTFCSFPDLSLNYDAYKLKCFQTIELLYDANETTEFFKTDDFYRKFYFSRNLSEPHWYRFDAIQVTLEVPEKYVPLLPYVVYEFICLDEKSFYLVAKRDDKTIPDSNFKINSIVFNRQQLHDIFASRRVVEKNKTANKRKHSRLSDSVHRYVCNTPRARIKLM